MAVNRIIANLSLTRSIPHDVRGSRRFYSKGRTTMKNKFIAFLSACACAGAVGAGVLNVDVKSYDFSKIVVKGTDLGSATMTINGAAATIGSRSATELVATGLTAGNVYKYTVTLGSDSKSGEITMGNKTDALFGASAASGFDVPTAGSWNTTAPYVKPTVTNNKYELLGSNNKFVVNNGVTGGKKIVYIDSTMTFSDGADELDETLEALGAFTLAQTNETVETDFFWAGLTGGTTKWVKLTGVEAAAGSYVSRMEFDFNQTQAKVRYSVGESVSALTVLKDAQGNEWFDANSSAMAVASVAYEGTGSLASFEGSSIETKVAQVGSEKYDTIAAALSASKVSPKAVTLLTNTKPEANEALNGGEWAITRGAYAFEPTAATGYDFTYNENTFKVMAYQTSVAVSGANTIGYDFTNSAITVTISSAHIQAGTSVSATVTVKDAKTGAQVGSQTIPDITGDGAQVPVNVPVTAQGDYTYEVVVKKGDDVIATYKDSFSAGNQANWFNAYASHWADDGSWKKGDETVTIDADKIALGGNEYMFTATTPSASDGIVRVDTVIEVDGAIDSEDLDAIATNGVQGMITIAETSATDATPVWKAYVGSAWKTLTGDTPETANVSYTVRAEFDYRNATAKKVRYSVAKDGGTFKVLKDDATEWLANGISTATNLASTTAVGAGNLVSLKGDNIDYYLAEVDGVKYEDLDAAFAAAKASGKSVTMLWDATWDPSIVGQWPVSDGKNLIINAKSGWGVKKSGNTWLVADTEVAKVVGGSNYFFLDEAFVAVAANGTVQMLTNLVQGVDVAANKTAILDLGGCFVKFRAGALTASDLTITNATDVIGGFNGSINGTYKIAGGKWATGDSTKLMTGYKLVPLATTETVDGVTYTHEAIWTTIDNPEKAKVVPVVIGGGDDQPAEPVVVDNDFVKDNIGPDKTPAQIAEALTAPRDLGNKLPLIQSYVLGLTPTDETSKPVVKSEQNAKTDEITLSLGNVSVNTAAGVPVKFVLKAAATPAMTDATQKGENTEPRFTVDVPTTDAKVQYYKIEAVIGK